MNRKTWLLAAALSLACAPAFAQNRVQYTAPDGVNGVNVTAATPLPVAAPASSVTGSVSAATVGTSSAQVLAAASRRFLAIDNESATATVACAFGATAAINTAGSFTLPPSVTRTWTAYPVPADAVNCIASGASTPVTVEAN